MGDNPVTNTPAKDMAPICEAIDAVIKGYTIRIGNDVIKTVETVTTRDGIEINRRKDVMKLDIDDLLNGRYQPGHFGSWDCLIEAGINEFSIVDMAKFQNLKGCVGEDCED